MSSRLGFASHGVEQLSCCTCFEVGDTRDCSGALDALALDGFALPLAFLLGTA